MKKYFNYLNENHNFLRKEDIQKLRSIITGCSNVLKIIVLVPNTLDGFGVMHLFNNIPEIKYSYKNLITYSNNSSLDQSNIMNKFSKKYDYVFNFGFKYSEDFINTHPDILDKTIFINNKLTDDKYSSKYLLYLTPNTDKQISLTGISYLIEGILREKNPKIKDELIAKSIDVRYHQEDFDIIKSQYDLYQLDIHSDNIIKAFNLINNVKDFDYIINLTTKYNFIMTISTLADIYDYNAKKRKEKDYDSFISNKITKTVSVLNKDLKMQIGYANWESAEYISHEIFNTKDINIDICVVIDTVNKIITMSIDDSNKFNLWDIYHKVNVMSISTNEILFNIDNHCDINAFGLKAITNLFN